MNQPFCRYQLLQYLARFVFIVPLLVFLNATGDFNHLGPDTTEYLDLSQEISSGKLFSRRDLGAIPLGSVIRTPGFPALLAIGKFFAPNDLRLALLLGHSLLFVAVFLIISSCARRYASPPLIALLLFPALIPMQEVFVALASEWTAFCFLLIIAGLALFFFERPTKPSLLLLGLAASLAVLTRPALVVVLTLPFLGSFFLADTSWIKRCALASSSLLVLLCWMEFNALRLGSFSIAPRGGANLFCIGALIGKAGVEKTDYPQISAYFQALDLATYSISSGSELVEESKLDVSLDFYKKYVTNMLIADRIAASQGINRIQENQYLGIYGMRSIRKNFSNYILHLYYGSQNFLFSAYLLLPAFFVPLYWLKSKKYPGLSLSTLCIFYVHAGHLVVVLLTQPLSARYYAVTLYPLQFMSFLVVYQFGKDVLLSSAKGRPRSS